MDGHSSSRCRRASAPTAGCMVHRSHQSFLKDPFIFPKDSHAPTLEFSNMCLLIKSCQCTHSHSLVHAYRFCRLTRTHTHTRGSYTQRSRHFKARRSSVRQEAAWQTPACRIKTYHPLSFSPYRRGGFCMGLAETWFWGCYLFISSVIKGSGSVTCLWWGGVQRTAIPSVMDFSTQILHRFDLWYNIEWYAAHATQ